MHPEIDVRHYCNLLALEGLDGLGTSFAELAARVAEAGYQGIQFIALLSAEQDAACRAYKLGRCSSGRVNLPREVALLAERCHGEGMECVTLHVGWGLEDDSEADALISAILEAVQRWQMPLFVETHRATIFQDMWRTVQFVKRFPELRFNGDFSHWYTGQEMVYGGFDRKLEFIQPVIERVRFIHGRIGNPGHIQVDLPLENPLSKPYVQHFVTMWRACLEGAPVESPFWFVPELLSSGIYYAASEESDRWTQMLLLRSLFPTGKIRFS